MEELCFYFGSLSVFVCVCLSVRLWTKYRSNRNIDFDMVFAKRLLLALAQAWNWRHLKVTATQYKFFYTSTKSWRGYIFFPTSLLCISALLFTIKMKIGLSLELTLGQFVFKFHKNLKGNDVIVTSDKFSPNNYPYLTFYWTKKLRTWNQYTTT